MNQRFDIDNNTSPPMKVITLCHHESNTIFCSPQCRFKNWVKSNPRKTVKI